MTLVGGTIPGIRKALTSLDGSLLVKAFEAGKHIWRYKHPTIRDAFAALVAEDLELLDIYLIGSPAQTMFSEITCGMTEIEGAKVIVPADRFGIVINRLDEIDTTKWDRKSALYRFLTYRCSREFLAEYLKSHPSFAKKLNVMSQMSVVSDIALAARLNHFELLPEEERCRIVQKIKILAVETPDASFLDNPIRTLISSDEMQDILLSVQDDLLPNLDDKIDEWESNYDPDDDPDSHFSDFERTLNKYREEFSDDEEINATIRSALVDVESAVERMRSRWPDREQTSFFGSEHHTAPIQESSRSIFDDVDM